jgi:phosphatidylglycerophosphate synthase
MFDRHIYRAIGPTCSALARPLARLGVRADLLTITAFVIGLTALPLLIIGHHYWALGAIILNRFLDGIDGALARLTEATDRGAFLDISLDFLFYAAIPLGFAVFDPKANALAAACLLFSFTGTASTFLAFSLIAERRGVTTPHFRNKGIVYLGGVAEGFETILFFVAMCLWPAQFAILAYVFALLCWLTVIVRLCAGWRIFS